MTLECGMEASQEARRRLDAAGGAPLALDWRDAVFFHLAADPAVLQPQVPYPLDLYRDEAYVSIVAFDQTRFRATFGRGLLSPLIRPLGSYLICNLRTYVRYREEPGVFFMQEWMPNPVSPLLVNQTYGLPQRLARIRYEHDRAQGLFFGHITARGRPLSLTARIDYAAPLRMSEPGSLDDFLLERFTGFQIAIWGHVRFRLWHVPWLQQSVHGEIADDALLRATGPWYGTARLVTTNYSPGVAGVQLGLPLPV